MRCYIYIIFLFLSTEIFSQNIIRSTLSSLNTSDLSSSVSLHSSLGQSSISGTLSSSNGIIRQGFQQPIKDTITNIINYIKPSFEVTVSPNPFRNTADIYIIAEKKGNYNLTLRTITGVIIWEKKNIIDHTLLKKDMLPAGLYLLEVRNETSISQTKVVIE